MQCIRIFSSFLTSPFSHSLVSVIVAARKKEKMMGSIRFTEKRG